MNIEAVNDKKAQLKLKANKLPLEPGVYIMKNSQGEIIYIGKAKALKNRVTQYFGLGNQHTEKVRKMVSNVFDFEYIVCTSEFEALILENSLIKQHQPKYNILLKDDKGYSYIKITKEKWPRIETAKIVDKSGEFIGPYNSGFIVKETVDEVRKIFKLPDCNRGFDKPSKPCLNFHIGICQAPCRGNISYDDYIESIEGAKEFIKNGDSDILSISVLQEKMETAAENLQFETAAKLRDRINAIKKIKEKQSVVSINHKSQDLIASVFFGETACVQIFSFRNHKLVDKNHYIIDGFSSKESLYNEFLQQYYINKSDIPPRILIDFEGDFPLISEWLSKKSGHKIEFINPKFGEGANILSMCLNNAAENLSQKIERTGKETSALNDLAELLGLNSTPHYIEAYDISNIMGTNNVAGMIVFKDARPFKSAYRRFKIKGFVGQDDYQSMAEVLDRRFNEYKIGSDKAFATLPDLILLDGAKGQIGAVLPILEKYNLNIPVFGMVKDSKHRTRAIATNSADISIKANKRCFNLVTAIQDEVHRFAISYHKTLRSKNMLKSELLEIKGIGKRKAEILLKHFKSIKKIKEATTLELSSVKGITQTDAQSIKNFYNT